MCATFSESYEAMATSKAADTGELDEKPNREPLQWEPSRTASTARRIRQPGSGLGHGRKRGPVRTLVALRRKADSRLTARAYCPGSRRASLPGTQWTDRSACIDRSQ